MALLIMNPMTKDNEEWIKYFQTNMPELVVRFWPELGDPYEIEYLIFGKQDFDNLPKLPNLKFMMTRQAGVDSWIRHPNLPRVPLTKLEPPNGDSMMTEYVVMHTLRLHRNILDYRQQQNQKIWRPIQQHRPEDRRIGFLGFGTLAKPPARILKLLGFEVAAWTRTPKPNNDIPIFYGRDQLEDFLKRTDISICLLPLTKETRGIINSETISMMPRGAMIINVGRGEHIIDEDLLEGLDSGHLAAASLDTTFPEPLPRKSPLWSHPKITIMPHVARRPPVKQLAPQIMLNIRRFEAGEDLVQVVDVDAGY